MGRKRTSTKKDFTLSVDEELIKKLKELEVNSSALFTDAARKVLEKYDENGKLDTKSK